MRNFNKWCAILCEYRTESYDEFKALIRKIEMLSQYLTQKNADDLNFIKQILHKSGFLNVQNIIRLRSGSRSVAYYADGYIVRFPKAEIIWQTMKREKNIIDIYNISHIRSMFRRIFIIWSIFWI